MGRRAKNKQSDPTPLADASQNKPSAKKLGKRKADAENDERETLSKRPVKKARESGEKKVAKKGSEGELKKKKDSEKKDPQVADTAGAKSEAKVAKKQADTAKHKAKTAVSKAKKASKEADKAAKAAADANK